MMPKRLASTDPTKALEEVDGSGPFIFKKDEFVPGNVAAFVPNPAYKPRSEPADGLAGGKVAKVDRVELVSMADPATQVSALQTGELDYVEYPPFDLLDVLKGDPNVKVVDPGLAAGNMGFVRPNHLQPPFTDVRVRRAMALAINRKDVLTAIGVPEGDMDPKCVSIFSCGGPYEARKGGEDMTGDTAEAATALLKEAGYKGEEIVLMAPTGGDEVVAAPVVVEQLRKVGFNVRLEMMELNTLFDRRATKALVKDGGWSAFMVFLGAGDISSPATHLYINNNCNPDYAGWSCDEEMKKLLDAFRAEPDYEKRRELADQINVRAYANVPAALWGAYTSPIAYRTELSGLIEKTTTPVFWNVEKK
jgi:peptide/nickel transport system substrate-binding protein